MVAVAATVTEGGSNDNNTIDWFQFKCTKSNYCRACVLRCRLIRYKFVTMSLFYYTEQFMWHRTQFRILEHLECCYLLLYCFCYFQIYGKIKTILKNQRETHRRATAKKTQLNRQLQNKWLHNRKQLQSRASHARANQRSKPFSMREFTLIRSHTKIPANKLQVQNTLSAQKQNTQCVMCSLCLVRGYYCCCCWRCWFVRLLLSFFFFRFRVSVWFSNDQFFVFQTDRSNGW